MSYLSNDDYIKRYDFDNFGSHQEFQNESHEQKSYRDLWQAVIGQAVTDSVSNYNRTENKVEKKKVLSWFSDYSDDFITVCDLASCNPQYVRLKAKKAMEFKKTKSKS